MRRWAGLERRRMGGFVPAAAPFGTFTEVPDTWNSGPFSSYHSDTSHSHMFWGDFPAAGDLLVACIGWASLQPGVAFTPDPSGPLWGQIASVTRSAASEGGTVYSGELILWRVAADALTRDVAGDWTPGAQSGAFVTIFRPSVPGVQLAGFRGSGAADTTTPLSGSLGATGATQQLTLALAVDNGDSTPGWFPKLTGPDTGWTGFRDGFQDEPSFGDRQGSLMSWYQMTTGAAQSFSVSETVYAPPSTPGHARPWGVLMAGFTCGG